MPKASKPSASSGTRKKHARKAAGPPNTSPQPPQNTKSKPSKKDIKKGLAPPPKKSYIPPSKLKPAPPQADPLDGLGSLLPADLVVILRRLAKKDGVTKSRALEELEAWVRRAKEESRDPDIGSTKPDILVTMLPVWLHRFPALCVHQSRRIRHLSASLHALLLEIPAVRASVILFLSETGLETQVSQVLGSWCLSAWDVDRGVAARAGRSWKEAVEFRQGDDEPDPASTHGSRFVLDDDTLAQSIVPFIITTIMDPSATSAALNPSSTVLSDSPGSSHFGTPRRGAPGSTGTPPGSAIRRVLGGEEPVALTSRGEDEPESVEDRNARLRVGAMGALRWIFDTCTPTAMVVAPLHSLLSSPTFWTILHHASRPPFLHSHPQRSDPDVAGESSFSISVTAEGFGTGQTIVRRAGWSIVQALTGGRASGSKDERWTSWVGHTGVADQDYSPALRLISSAILRSAFVEPDSVVRSSMWEPLLIFLTKISSAWVFSWDYDSTSASSGKSAAENDRESDSGSESSSSAEDTDQPPPQPEPNPDQEPPSSLAYTEFLTFLGLGCNGSSIQGYPTVLVILSTIPAEILPPTLPALSGFFDALWAAVDGQALSALATERARATEAFLGAWGECLVWTAGRLIKGVNGSASASALGTIAGDSVETAKGEDEDDSPRAVVRALVEQQFWKLTRELERGGVLRVEAGTAGVKVAVILEKLEVFARDLRDEAWVHIARYVRGAVVTVAGSDDEARRGYAYALAFVVAVYEHLLSGVDAGEGASLRGVEKLVSGIAEDVVQRCLDQKGEGSGGDEDGAGHVELMLRDGSVVEMLLQMFGGILKQEARFIELFDTLMTAKLPALVAQPSLILSYLKHRADTSRRLAIWHLLLSTLGSSPVLALNKRVNVLSVLLGATKDVDLGLRTWAKPQGEELQGLAGQIFADALGGDAVSSSLVAKLLQTPEPFIGDATAHDLISSIVATVDSHIQPLIHAASAPLEALRSSLNLLLALERAESHVEIALVDILPRVFVLAFVMPRCFSVEEELEVAGLARQIWEAWRARADGQSRETVARDIKRLMKELIMDTDVRPRPVAILQALPHVNPDVDTQPLVDVVPTQFEFSALLPSTSADPIDSSLAVIEPLAPPLTTKSSKRSLWNNQFDSLGFSPYARGVNALLHVLTTDRHLARENMWALQHALTLALFASEVLQVPGADSPVFRGQQAAGAELREITRLTQQVAAFLLTSAAEGAWHKDVVDVLSGKVQPGRLDSMGEFVRLVFEQAKAHDAVRDSLVLHTVLQHVLRSATKDDADIWIDLARGLQEQALQTSLAISLAVTEFAPEPPKLDRYRNELASTLTGIPARKANTAGLRLLRCLSAVAPNPESEVIFLPQQRAVYLVQALQAWMGSDEDLDESVESEVTLVLFNLAPILQNVQGAHWEFTMDLIESNIENSSFNDADTLVILSRTLRLLTSIRDLASSNKYLRELWTQRSKTILVLVRDLLAVKSERTVRSVPRAICREQALSIVQGLPGSLMDENTLSTMCHLLTDPSVDNQKMAYQMLQQAAARRTEHLVLEAGVDAENTAVIELPHELILLLQSGVNFEDADADAGGQDLVAYLLAWMIAFDLFIDTSLKVKTAYVDHLRTLDLIGGFFLPSVFEILGVGAPGGAFKLDAWVVDEYWLPLYDAAAPQSVQLLAAHIYYRALRTVPSLVRTWWEDLKDRQLSAAITAFTSAHFSPVLIAAELRHLKPGAGATTSTDTPGANTNTPGADPDPPLSDETFHVRVALAVSEVSAAFSVDEQQMEIAVKLPRGYPLRTVDVRPVRRVGVPEKVWRRWLFAVQQVVTAHNGRIVDGLALFKRTVSLHFEGQVECAICYSILHVVDRSLPAKPCKTCKNRFHAGCLYKWFNTSHTSSCPLCRSDIM